MNGHRRLFYHRIRKSGIETALVRSLCFLLEHRIELPTVVTVQDILQAQQRIRPYLNSTPLRRSFLLSERTAISVLLKMENWQVTGSFKPRGALNLMAMLNDAERARGVVTASAGNHALGVGYAARLLHISPATIFLPRTAPRAKLDKLREYPVEVRPVGETYEDAHHAALAFERETGAIFVDAYDDPRTVAGQGTIGLEILQETPEVDAILVPVGGGGMISGIAIAAKSLAPSVRIIAIQPAASPALRDSLRDDKCYEEYPAAPTICDGLAGGIGRIVFDVAKQGLIDEVVLVEEEETKAAIRALVETQQLIVEGSGAVGVAALLAGRVHLAAKSAAVVLSGGNIDLSLLSQILQTKP
ncbi:MAG: threonine ammonia-lyase [Acidobacteriota bacterium]